MGPFVPIFMSRNHLYLLQGNGSGSLLKNDKLLLARENTYEHFTHDCIE